MIAGQPRILIIRLSAIGDVVRVLPAVSAIRQAFPSARIDWVVESAASDILQNVPALDRVIVFDRSPHIFRSVRLFRQLCLQLREQHYDIAIDFHGIFKSGILLLSTRAARRIAFAPPRAREMSHRFANELVTLPAPIMNRVDENLELCYTIAVEKPIFNNNVGIDKQINANVFRSITEQRTDRPWLALIHAPIERAEKRWPAEYFAALVDMLIEDGRFDVVLSHGPGQRLMLSPILEKCRHKPIVPPPCDSLREFAGLVSMASLYIGGDTGPMHIAAAVGTPVVAVFGGTDPRMHSPVGSPSQVLGGVSLSRPTEKVPMDQSERILREVTPADVFAASIELLDSVK